ncbi:CBS domain-containing protein [Halobacteriales archaeon QH_6_64_20]|nr:MAG: CBS domain-containing protein [Halobacteriales archaeon QH_6_64_20]
MPVETPVSEIMSTPVERIDGSDSVGAAAQALTDQGIGSLVVGTDEIEGIITESDIVASVASKVDPETQVTELLSDPVVTITSDATVSEAGAQMGEHNIKRLPVTEGVGGDPIGIVTTTDLAGYLSSR